MCALVVVLVVAAFVAVLAVVVAVAFLRKFVRPMSSFLAPQVLTIGLQQLTVSGATLLLDYTTTVTFSVHLPFVGARLLAIPVGWDIFCCHLIQRNLPMGLYGRPHFANSRELLKIGESCWTEKMELD